MKKHILLALLFGINISNIFCTTRKVPLNYPTIQAAIMASNNTDTVEVSPGTYFENINFRGKKILVTSLFYLSKDTSYISSTIINGSTPINPDTASCVIFNSGEDSTAILQGFTLTGGKGTKWTDIHGAGTYREGGGILMDVSSPTIRYNIIISNTATNTSSVVSAGGGGIRIGDGNPIIENNIITNNQGKYGPGIVLNYTGCRIKNNIIALNTGATSYFGGSGIWIYNDLGTTPKIIENNTIIKNSSYSVGTGGISAELATNVIIRNNIIWGNLPVANQIIATSCTVQATYNDVQNAYTGVGNINANPLLDSLCLTLSAASPCIDAGDTSTVYNDLTSAPNTALFPSMGTARNDMGAYGGPDTFVMHCSKIVVSGILELSNVTEHINVYPNPTTGQFTVETNINNKQTLQILDVNGKLVFSQLINGTANVDVTNLNAGVYTLAIKTADSVMNKKLVIVH
jgi:hypothetical protein